jgi:hypothetical protein
MTNRLVCPVLLAATVVGAACASAPDPGFGEDMPNEVDLVIVNDYRITVTAHVQWLQGTPSALGEIAAGESMLRRVPIRGQEVRVLFVPIGMAAGDPAEPQSLPVRRGDQMEWRLGSDRFVIGRRLNE